LLKKQIIGCVLFTLVANTTIAAEVTSQVVLRSDRAWDGTPYRSYPAGVPELTVLKIVLPPHSTLDWHEHPMPNVAYVLSGELTVEKADTMETLHLKQGEALPEMVDSRHRGMTGNRTTELIVFYAGAKGLPVSVKDPAN
jgi:quercetin dioxygenase-like cupin family protein